MSIESLSYALNADVGDPTRKLILLGYANHAHRDGTAAWPGIDLIAEYAGCSRRTVQRHLRTLVEEGWMHEGDQTLVSHLRADRRPVVYDVAMSTEVQAGWASEQRGDNLTPRERGDTGDADEAHGVTPVTERGDTAVSPEPSGNRPSDEPSNPSLRSGATQKRGTRLPEDWQPSESLREWFRQHPELHVINPVAETEKFKDYWKAQTGQRATKTDWDATWRNWMREGAERINRRQTGPQHPKVDGEHRDRVSSLF